MKKTYTFFTDPGHGWLRVPRRDLQILYISRRITPFSYQKGAFVYLEEDCDASLFLRTAKAVGWDVTVRERASARHPSIIRQFDAYRLKVKRATFTPLPFIFGGQGWVNVPDEYTCSDVFLSDIGLQPGHIYDFRTAPRRYRVSLLPLLRAAEKNDWEVEILPEYTPERGTPL
jgi:hypothetical protein